MAALQRSGAAVLQAPPGAGKTTRVPLAIAGHPAMAGRKVLVLEPRRLAARLAASHMAGQLGQAVGQRVGYRVRLERKVGPQTQVELVTDGLYLRQLQEDPELTEVGCVIFDEVHERGLESDLALALTLEARSALRPDLWILAMSATLEAEPWVELLGGAPLIESQGRSHPVEILWRPPDVRERWEVALLRVVKEALKQQSGSLLVFLPGQGEIRRAAQTLEKARLPDDVALAPLYGDLGQAAQAAALRPAPAGRRKLVLATAIAETSLTIEGIQVVIDAGLARGPRYDPRSGMTRLETLPASRATATQRAGRAGRLGPGVCYRLWEEAEHRARSAQPAPEILVGDPLPLALELALWGAGDGAELSFLDPPPSALMEPARLLLTTMGALTEGAAPTAHGRALGRLGLHPRLGHMVLAAAEQGLAAEACALAALLSGRGLLRGGQHSNLRHHLEAFREPKLAGAGLDRGALREAQMIARQLGRQVKAREGRALQVAAAGRLLALAYPDRLAKRQEQEPERTRYRLANGRPAQIPSDDPLALEPWLAVADLGGGSPPRIMKAAAITQEEIEESFVAKIAWHRRVAWDPKSRSVLAREERRFEALALGQRPLARPDPEELARALAEGVRRLGVGALPFTAGVRALQARIAFAARWSGDNDDVSGDGEGWPQVDDTSLLADPFAWLGSQLWGRSKIAELEDLDLEAAILALLSPGLRRALDRLAPKALSLAGGRTALVDYAADPPIASARLQSLFGILSIPKVGGGRVAIRLALLSPADRPVAVTGDLEHFWHQVYPQVRAELRGRYRKHAWPEDPMNPEAVEAAKTGKRIVKRKS